VVLGRVYSGPSGTETNLWWTEWYWDRLVLDKVALVHLCGGTSSCETDVSMNFEDFSRHSSVYKFSVFLRVSRCGHCIPPYLTNTMWPHHENNKLHPAKSLVQSAFCKMQHRTIQTPNHLLVY
jgi:hypothetical protein